MKSYGLMLSIVAILFFAGQVNAEMITIQFTGVVDVVNTYNPDGLGGIAVGDSFSGYYTYDSTLSDDPLYSSDPTWGHYDFTTSSEYGMWTTAEGITYSTVVDPDNYILIMGNNPYNPDSYEVWGNACTPFPSNSWIVSQRLILEDSTKTTFTSDALPTTAPDLTSFDTNFFTISARDPANHHHYDLFVGHITSIAVQSQPIPEPSTMLLFGSGLLGLWGLRRKFKK